MNVREGSRRLALLLGVVGALFGGFMSFLQLQQVLNQRSIHNSLEGDISQMRPLPQGAVVDSDFLKGAIKVGELEQSGSPPTPATSPSQPKEWDASGKPIVDYDALAAQVRAEHPAPAKADKWQKYTVPPDDLTSARKPVAEAHGNPADSTLVSTKNDDSRTLYPTPAPSIWRYALLFLWPLVGFFIPWGTIRGIVWVVTGFIQTSP